MVLIHGLALDCRMWDDQIPVLRRAATVIRYDVRGFGRSSRADDVPYTHWDDLWRLLDELGVQAAVLVGLSMGGGIALKATIDAPSRVLALVLLDAVVDGVPWDDGVGGWDAGHRRRFAVRRTHRRQSGVAAS